MDNCCSSFDFSCMAQIEVGIMYYQIVKGTITMTLKVDRSVWRLNTKPCRNVPIKYINKNIY